MVSMVGSLLGPPKASGMIASASLATHCFAPAGLSVSSHSLPNRISRKLLPHWVGVVVQVTSRPLVIASAPLPLPWALCQPRPCEMTGQPSGSAPTRSASPAPWVLPNECPPAISAKVSSSFIAIRRNVSRMSRAEATGSGLPLGPSGFT